MGDKNQIISPIAIDMGAKNTGVYYAKYSPNANIAEIEKHGEVLVYDKYTALLRDRTANRHVRRGYQRNKLAKRLLVLVLKEYFNFPAEDHTQAIGFLLNRRGYTFLEQTYKKEYLAELPNATWNKLSAEVKELLENDQNDLNNTLEELADNDPAEIKKLVEKIDQIEEKQQFQTKKKAYKADHVYYDYLEKIAKACDLVIQGEIVTDEQLKLQKNDTKKLTETQNWIIQRLNNPHITAEAGIYKTDLTKQISISNAQILKQQLPDIAKARGEITAQEKENNKSTWDFNSAKFEFNDKNTKGLEADEANKAKTHLHHLCFAIYTINQELISGNRHRSKYFKEIKKDLKNLANHPHKYLADFAQAIQQHKQLDLDKELYN